jgi:hypothetical protein
MRLWGLVLIMTLLIGGCGMMGSKQEENTQSQDEYTSADSSLELNQFPSSLSMELPNISTESCENYNQVKEELEYVIEMVHYVEEKLFESNASIQILDEQHVYDYQSSIYDINELILYYWSEDKRQTFTNYETQDLNLSVMYKQESFMEISFVSLTELINVRLLQMESNQFTFMVNRIAKDSDNLTYFIDIINNECHDTYL